MKRATTIILVSAIVLIAYGYICRLANFYFFWDSKIIGWCLLFIGIFIALITVYRSRKHRGKKTIWVKIAIAFFIVGFIATPVAGIGMEDTDAYAFAVGYIQNDSTILKDVGSIKGLGFFPTGSVTTVSVNGIESGDASFTFTVKGAKKYRDIKIHLQKQPGSDWKVVWLE